MTRRVAPNGLVETFAYDVLGNMTAHTDFNGKTTTFEYDGNQQVTRKNLPDGTAVAYRYTAAGRRIEAGGDSFAYDSRGRLVTETKSDGEVIRYTYDAAGNRTSVTTSAGTTTYTYDALNRLASVTDADGGVTTYAYDEVGNRASVTHPNNTQTRYRYDALNRLTKVETVNLASAQVIASYEYTLDPAGHRTRVVEHGGRTVDYEYDALYRLTQERIADAGGITTLRYTYDAVGNRRTMTVNSPSRQIEVVYTCDANDRLIRQDETVTTAAADADDGTRYAAGARPSRAGFHGLLAVGALTVGALLTPFGLILPSGQGIGRRSRRRRFFTRTVALLLVPSMVISPENVHAMHVGGYLFVFAAPTAVAAGTTTSTLTYTYDNNGNMTGRTDGTKSDTYSYDAENRLISSTIEIGPSPGPVSYTYDADGIRTGKTAAGVTTQYVTDKSGPLAEVVIERSNGTTVTYTYGGDRISMKRPASGTSYYLYDGRMSVRQLANATGAVTDTYVYDAFGTLLASTGTTVNAYRYTGQQYDPNVGFYYLRARYYAEAIGRFISQDPATGSIFDPPSLHRYLYAHADPVNNFDPTGAFTIGIVGIAISIGIVGALISAAWWKPTDSLLANLAIGFAIGFLSTLAVAYAFGLAGTTITIGGSTTTGTVAGLSTEATLASQFIVRHGVQQCLRAAAGGGVAAAKTALEGMTRADVQAILNALRDFASRQQPAHLVKPLGDAIKACEQYLAGL